MNPQIRYEKRNKPIDNFITKYISNDSFNIINFLILIILIFIMINLILSLIKKKNIKVESCNQITVSRFSKLYTTLISLILFTVFIYLDIVESSKFWENCGPIVKISSTSNEPIREGYFLLRKWNAHTSLALFSSGVFIILKTYELNNLKYKFINGCLKHYILGILLIFLGIASYGWWGSKRYVLWRADHALMEGVNMYLTFVILSCSGIFKKCNEKKIMILSLFIWFVRIFYMGQANLLLTISFCFISIPFTIIYAKSLGRVYLLKLGILLTLLSIFFKIADISNTLISGTGWFHIFISCGITSIWLWCLTVQ